MQKRTKCILDTWTAATVCSTSQDINHVLKEYQTKTYCYVLICDEECVIIGEGTSSRGYVTLPGRAAPAHLKAITCALAYHTSTNHEVVIIPTHSKSESQEIEQEIKHMFDFHSETVDSKNEMLLEKRMQQLGKEIDPVVKAHLLPLLYATGTDMGTFKKYKHTLSAEVMSGISEIFGGYFNDI